MPGRKSPGRKEALEGVASRLPRATVLRLSWYLRHLQGLDKAQAEWVSSHELAEALGVTAAQVRKDLAAIGSFGHPGIGYRPDELASAIRGVLGLDRSWSVVLVGVGNLARALLRYAGFRQQGFQFVAIFDADPAKVGQVVENLPVLPMERLAEVVRQTGAQLGIISVPAEAAQRVAAELVAAGIRGILNFAPVMLRVPLRVSLVSVDLTVQLEQLSHLVLHHSHANGRNVQQRSGSRPA